MIVPSSLSASLSQRYTQSTRKQASHKIADLPPDTVYFSRPNLSQFADDDVTISNVTFSDLQAAEKVLSSHLRPKDDCKSLANLPEVHGVGVGDVDAKRALALTFSTKEDRDNVEKKILRQPGTVLKKQYGNAGQRIVFLSFTPEGQQEAKQVPILLNITPTKVKY